jgi:endo-1,4-beta-xylanase
MKWFSEPACLASSLSIGGLACTGAPGGNVEVGGMVRDQSGAVDITCELRGSFSWESSAPLISAVSSGAQELVSIKDPTVVFYGGKWHIYATTASSTGAWNMVYLSFSDWSEAASAPQYYMGQSPIGPGYYCAPQLFYFRPQQKWYLVYQSGPPQYSTNDDPGNPSGWSQPKSFFGAEPAIVTQNKGNGGWLDFWVICDETHCHLFFTDDNGNFYRSQTKLEHFPKGFGEPVMVLSAPNKNDLFEASNVYRIKGTNKYLAINEAIGPNWTRYFRSWTADRLDGVWTPLADTFANPFAGLSNVAFAAGVEAWTKDVSHGEMLRDGYDETMTIDPCNLRYLYQGVDPANTSVPYSQLPYKLGLLTLKD